MSHSPGGEVGPRSDLLTRLEEYWRLRHETRRKQAILLANGLIKPPKTEKFTVKIEKLLLELYQDAPDGVKAAARKAMRAAFKSVILAYWLGEAPKQVEEGKATFVFNININENTNVSTSNTNINVNISIEEINYVRRLINDLLRLVSEKDPNPRLKAILGERARKAHAILDKLTGSAN